MTRKINKIILWVNDKKYPIPNFTYQNEKEGHLK